jgi:hypothetical protein
MAWTFYAILIGMTEIIFFIPMFLWVTCYRRSFVDWIEWMNYDFEKVNFWEAYQGAWQGVWPTLMLVHFILHVKLFWGGDKANS